MSQAQPLSTLAPEYSNQLQPVQQVVVTQVPATHLVLDPSCPPKKIECPPKKPECPPKPVECPKKVIECPPKPVECPPKPVECPPKKCEDPCAPVTTTGYGWGWLGALILWFIIFTVLFWLIFYSLKPSFVLQTDSNQVDTAKVLLAAVIAALILVIVIWLIKAAVSRRY
jgi:outer membrane biosynthesis protein TonB